MMNDGRSPAPRGRACAPSGLSRDASQAEPLVPNADDGEYRMNPDFRRFLSMVGPLDRAVAAWAIAKEAFAPTTEEGEFEVWQDDMCVAGCSGPRSRALAEAVHYAVVYQTDESPCIVQEVRRTTIDPDEAHYLIASAIETEGQDPEEGLGAEHESATAKPGRPTTVAQTPGEGSSDQS